MYKKKEGKLESAVVTSAGVSFCIGTLALSTIVLTEDILGFKVKCLDKPKEYINKTLVCSGGILLADMTISKFVKKTKSIIDGGNKK